MDTVTSTNTAGLVKTGETDKTGEMVVVGSRMYDACRSGG